MYPFYIDADYMNANKLAQDHPCVVDTIRRHYLDSPSPIDVAYKLDNITSTEADHSQAGQVTTILGLLKNKVIYKTCSN